MINKINNLDSTSIREIRRKNLVFKNRQVINNLLMYAFVALTIAGIVFTICKAVVDITAIMI
mgnify:FL=1